MAGKVSIDIEPMTRIEGHLGIHAEADLDKKKYVDAYCYSTMFRGIEFILKDREPADAIWLTQRVCGVCPTPHGTAAALAVDMCYHAPPPPFAVCIRNMIDIAEEVYDGALGCGILQGPDYSESVMSKTSPEALAQANVTKSPQAGLHGYATIGDIMRGLNPVSGSLWRRCLEASKVGIEMASLMGGKHPHVQVFVPGGVAKTVTPADMETYYALLAREVAFTKELVTVFDDLLTFCAEIGLDRTGVSSPNLISHGIYEDPAAYDTEYENMGAWGEKRAITPGVVIDGKLLTTDLREIQVGTSEVVAHSYYDDVSRLEIEADPQGNKLAKNHPWNEENTAQPGKEKDWQNKYSWAKSPRWRDWKHRIDGQSHVLEAGPLARLWISALAGKVPEAAGKSFKFTLPAGKVDGFPISQELPLVWKIPKTINALERLRARAYFHAFSAFQAHRTFRRTMDLIKKGQAKTWNRYSKPKDGIGVGLTEAMRGALGHWCVMRDGKIHRYQIITPTAWNCSPRDELGRPGPYESAIIGTPITEKTSDGELDGIDVVRTVRSFDPCLACCVGIYTPDGRFITSRELEHLH